MYLVKENYLGGWVIIFDHNCNQILVDRGTETGVRAGIMRDYGIPVHITCGDPKEIIRHGYPRNSEAIGKLTFRRRLSLAGTFMNEDLVLVDTHFDHDKVSKNKAWNDIQITRVNEHHNGEQNNLNTYIVVVGGGHAYLATIVTGNSCEEVMDQLIGHDLGDFDNA